MTDIQKPSNATLKKYGLQLSEWETILKHQGYVCAICKKVPSSGRFVVDHVHVRGFKKMMPDEKRQYVRGICCTHCNRFYLAKGITVEKAQNIVTYLTAYQGKTTK